MDFVKKFEFPKCISHGHLWLNSVRNKELDKLSYQDILKKKYFICHKHFTLDAFVLSEREVQRLFFPCLNLFNGNELGRRRRRGQTVDLSKKDEKVLIRRRLFSSGSTESLCSVSSDSESTGSPKLSYQKQLPFSNKPNEKKSSVIVQPKRMSSVLPEPTKEKPVQKRGKK